MRNIMTFQKTPASLLNIGALALCVLLASPAPSARANVYATNIKLDGNYTNLVCAPGTGLSISYLLNEPATMGVTVSILSGANAVRTIAVPAGSPGALRGANSVTWDGLDSNSNNLSGGTYSVAVTAAATGFTNWTQTSVDTNAGNYVYDPVAIAVDQNQGSRYFGRVFVSNAEANTGGTNVGDGVGILKLNADGSPAEESPTNWITTGGYDWAGDGFSPWKIRISADDHVYIMDDNQEGNPLPGTVYRWDPTLATNAEQTVLSTTNFLDQDPFVPSFALSGSGTNSQLWWADYIETFSTDPNFSKGVVRYNLTNGICGSNDTGTIAVGTYDYAGNLTGSNLDEAPRDVAIDREGNIDVIQDTNYISAAVLSFPAYNPASNGGAPEITPTWFVGNNDPNYAEPLGIAVNPASAQIAVAFQGSTNGSVKILSSTNGSLVANLDLGSGDSVTHVDSDCAWDAAGNVYVARYPNANAPGVWRVFSPPGTNQAVTVAPENFQVPGSPIQPPEITKIAESGGVVTITFTAASSEPTSAFLVLGASVVTGPYSAISGATVSSVSSGVFQATLPASLAQAYYRIEITTGVTTPRISTLTLSNNLININFTGSQADSPSNFHLQSASAPKGSFADVADASATQVGPGQFTFTTPVNAPFAFYRIRR
jgi:FlgD Ig-like domain